MADNSEGATLQHEQPGTPASFPFTRNDMMKKRVSHKNKQRLSGISSVFVEHSSFLKKFLTRFLNREQDIEDVVQEAYLKAYSIEQDRGEIEQPKAFLFSIAKNLALNELSRKSRQMTGYIEECQAAFAVESQTTVENEIEAHQSLGIYCEAVAALPEQCRRVYLLRKVHGLPHKEIGQRLGITTSAVQKHLRIGSLRCLTYVRKHGGGLTTAPTTHVLRAAKEDE
jgi:RNA polymerase sigma factor (sigma-70 family)